MTLFEKFVADVVRQIENGGDYSIQSCWAETTTGLEIMALMLEPEQIQHHSWNQCIRREVLEFAVALDRWTRPDQGTTRKSVVTIFHRNNATGVERCAVIEYDGPDAIDPPNFENAFWNGRMRRFSSPVKLKWSTDPEKRS